MVILIVYLALSRKAVFIEKMETYLLLMQKIKKALDIIHSSYRTKQIEICELAKSCAVSETYFRKLFKKTHGVSPIQYVIDLRVDFASHLLQSRLYTISEVATKS